MNEIVEYLEMPGDYHVLLTKQSWGPSLSAGRSLFLLMKLSPGIWLLLRLTITRKLLRYAHPETPA